MKFLVASSLLIGLIFTSGCVRVEVPSLENRLANVNRGYDDDEDTSATLDLEKELVEEAKKNLAPFISAFESKNPEARSGAVWILGFSKNPQAAPVIARSFGDRDLYVRGVGALAADIYVRENKNDRTGVKTILTGAADYLAQGPRAGETSAATLLYKNYSPASGRGLSVFLRKYGFTSMVSAKALETLRQQPEEEATVKKLIRDYLDTADRIAATQQQSNSTGN